MNSPTKVALGCGIAVMFCFVGFVAALVLVFVYAAQGVQGVDVAVDAPLEVVVGETFQLQVTVTNKRPRKALALSDIDIADEYLAGFIVLNMEPKAQSTMHVPIDNSQSFTFGVEIPPGESKTFTFTLRAEKLGIYRGDVDVCEGFHSKTGMAQTLVQEKK